MRILCPAALAAIAAVSGGAAYANHATLTLEPTPSCYTLYAGQTINAGSVCVVLNSGNLVAEYKTTGGWVITGAHTWIGETADSYPQGKNGNPQVGKFPYNSGALANLTSYSVNVPLSSVTAKFDDLDQYCLDGAAVPALFLMAHADLRKPTATGSYQTETGWADGARVVDRGSWATRSTLQFRVDCPEENTTTETEYGHETAWVFGDTTFDSLPSCGDDNIRGTADDGLDGGTGLLATRWGWSVGPVAPGQMIQEDIYAAAGKNDLAKGSLIGTATITNTGAMIEVEITTDGDYAFTTVQTYTGTDHTCTVAPGQLGDIKEYAEPAQSHVGLYAHAGGNAYLAIHLDAVGYCDASGNFCE